MQLATRTAIAMKPEIRDVVRDHYADVFRFCARRVGPEAAADAAQETFVTAQRSLSRFRGESSVRTWLFGIAINECRRLARKRKLESPILEPADEPAEQGVERRLVSREALAAALNKLSADHREAVVLHEIEGLTYDEAAVVLGVPAGTVKSRLHHAFVNLRQLLTEEAALR
jgi:RNA polymerase sigma-70 factor (ECF subfamily)